MIEQHRSVSQSREVCHRFDLFLVHSEILTIQVPIALVLMLVLALERALALVLVLFFDLDLALVFGRYH